MKQDMKQAIQETAMETAKAMKHYGRAMLEVNHYRAMERMLFAYKKMAQRVADHAMYVAPVARSKSITVAPTGGGPSLDADDRMEMAMLEREASYQRTKAQFEELDAIVRQYADDERFIVIRMYYFGEDVTGQDRAPDAEPYTLDAVAEELGRHARTVRRWRTDMVQDMTVQLFGIDGALSIEQHRAAREANTGRARPEAAAPIGDGKEGDQ